VKMTKTLSDGIGFAISFQQLKPLQITALAAERSYQHVARN
jgi:hypothetical protein